MNHNYIKKKLSQYKEQAKQNKAMCKTNGKFTVFSNNTRPTLTWFSYFSEALSMS